MKDTIYREDAIKAIEDRRCWLTLASQHGDMGHVLWDEYYIKFEDAIEALLLISSADRWIPCSERLPEEHTEVLLLGIKNMMVGYWQEGDFEGERAWRIMSGDGWETDATFPPDVFEPIAWMPLPEPWKGADDE